MISSTNLDWMWAQLNARLGTPYTWGGTLDPNDPSAGTDCSGAVGFVIEALLYGASMNWDRPFWTGTFAGMTPGTVAQPWGLVCIARPADAPADAAAIVAINQGASADTSHMIVRVLDRRDDPDGIDIEDNGQGLQKYDKAASITDGQFNQWFYLPGPLEMPTSPPSRADFYAQQIIDEGQRRGITARGIQIALATAIVESELKMCANPSVPGSEALPHDALSNDYDSVGLFQQRCPMWGPVEVLMDPVKSAGLFYDRLVPMDYNNSSISPGSFAADIQRPAEQYRGRYDEHFPEAAALYDKLIRQPPPPQPGLTMEQMVSELYAVWCTDRVASTSIYGNPTIKWFRKDKFDNMDGFLYDVWIERKAALGDKQALAQIRAEAASNPIASAMLARLTTTPPKESNPTPPSQPPTPPPTPPIQPTPTPPVQPTPAQTGTLTAAIASLQAFKQGLQRLIGG